MISLLFLLPLYSIWVQHERGGFWRHLWLVALVAGPADILLNYTELALLTGDFPKKGEYTFSKRLSRLSKEAGLRGDVCYFISKVLNRIAPSGIHIK